MEINNSFLSKSEYYSLILREYYYENGYTFYKSNNFEDYDYYTDIKDYLYSDNIFTFTDSNNRLKALRPDVTLSILKQFNPSDNICKLFYSENVYRPYGPSKLFKEIPQVGIECLGNLSSNDIFDVIILSLNSLKKISDTFSFNLSNNNYLDDLFVYYSVDNQLRKTIIGFISSKNSNDLISLNNDYPELSEFFSVLNELLLINGPISSKISCLEKLCNNYFYIFKNNSFIHLIKDLLNTDFRDNINLDFYITGNINYYNGIVFNGFVNEISKEILSGGQYDNLLLKIGKKSNAIGFAVYIAELDNKPLPISNDNHIRIALPKGRIGDKLISILDKMGYEFSGSFNSERKLIKSDLNNSIDLFWVKPSDVSIYVEHGIADIGIVGKDTILEQNPDVYELSDLNIGNCRMVVAGINKEQVKYGIKLKVATKYPNIAEKYFNKKGVDIELINLNGSIEIAPLLGLSDVIVDIVETGTTLKENNLIIINTITNLSARLISNKTSYSFKKKTIDEISLKMRALLNND